MCIVQNCKTKSTYGLNEKRTHCILHKTNEMKRIKPYVCIEKDCDTEASFNFEGETKRLYCVKHKKDNMISLDKKFCKEIGCNITSTFGYENSKREYCSKHKKDGMIVLHKKKTCLIENCNVFPHFNYISENAGLYCNKHKLENMIDVG